MPEATLIQQFDPRHVPTPLEANDMALLNAYYDKYGVRSKGPQEKISALKKTIQERSFYALGGEESDEIELRANERIFLMQMSRK